MIRLIKKSIIKVIGLLAFYLHFLPVSRKYSKEYKKVDHLTSVLTISEVDKKGGAAKIAYILHHTLLKRGINDNMIVNLVTEPEENIKRLEQRKNILSRILNIYGEKYQWFDFFKLASFDILKTREFKEADLVHMHNIHLNYFSKFVLPKLTSQKRTVWTLHDSLDLFDDFPDTESKTGEMDFYTNLTKKQRKKLREVSKRIMINSYLTVVTPSQWLYDKAKRGIFKETDVRLIPNGADENIFKPYDKIKVRRELKLPSDKKLLLFSAAWGLTAGTKDSGNTIVSMIEAFKDNHEIIFIVLGGASEDFDNDRSIIIPYISDQQLLAKYYSAADLFIYPTLWDNSPLAVIENMAVGTPVITYSTGGVPELVQHMKTGYVAEYNNQSDFIEGINNFINNDELRESASKQSRAVFLKEYTQTQMVNNYLNLYNELVRKY